MINFNSLKAILMSLVSKKEEEEKYKLDSEDLAKEETSHHLIEYLNFIKVIIN